jgi:hypothetical protein
VLLMWETTTFQMRMSWEKKGREEVGLMAFEEE